MVCTQMQLTHQLAIRQVFYCLMAHMGKHIKWHAYTPLA